MSFDASNTDAVFAGASVIDGLKDGTVEILHATATPTPAREIIHMEAEDGFVTPSMVIVSPGELTPPTVTTSTPFGYGANGFVTFNFDSTAQSQYVILRRAWGLTTEADSFWGSVDRAPEFRWNTLLGNC